MFDASRDSFGAQRLPTVARILLLASAYYLAGRFGLLLSIPPSTVAPLWPAAGAALAAVLIWGPRCWLGVLIGSFLVNLHISLDSENPASTTAFALSLAVGPTLQALASGWAIRRLKLYPSPLEEPREILQTLAVGAAGCLISPLYSNAILCLTGVTPWSALPSQAATWWIGDTLGVIVFTPALLLFGQPTASRARKAAVCLGLAVVFGVSLTMFLQAERFEERERQFKLDELSERLSSELLQQLHAYEGILHSIGSFLNAAPSVTETEFKAFTTTFLRQHPEILGFSWNQRVKNRDREIFEASVRALGFPDFAIVDRAPDGAQRRSPTRLEYYPVTFMNPHGKRPNAHGLDTYGGEARSGATRRETLDRARQTGELQATERVFFLRYPDQFGLLLYYPVYDSESTPTTLSEREDKLIGFASGVFLAPGVLEPIRRIAEKQSVDVVLTDLEAAPDAQTLFDSRLAPGEDARIKTERRGLLQSGRALEIAGRVWEVRILERKATALAHTPWNLWYVLLGGMLISSLSGAYLLTATARTDVIRRLVDVRTAALREREARLDAVISNSADGILTLDERNRIEAVNPACERMFGYAADEALGQPVEGLIHRGCAGCVDADLNCCLSAFEDCDRVGADFKGWRKNGGAFDLEISAGAFDLDGRRHVTLIVRDVTERRRAEATRETLLDDLQRSNEELARFAYVASHDLQEPLRKIAIFSGLLDSRYRERLDSEGLRFLATINNAALRMKALIHDLLSYSKTNSQSLAIETVRVDEAVARAQEMLASSIEETGAEISVHGAETVQADRVLMQQLLQNLLSNAIKYRGETPPRIAVTAKLVDGEQRLSVSDNGVGFDPAYAERIFAVFERLHRKEEIEGTGVGLAVCERVARRHGGRIWAESSPDRGATFTMAWPSMTVAAPPVRAETAVAGA